MKSTRNRPPAHPRLARFLRRLRLVVLLLLLLAVFVTLGGCFLLRRCERSFLYHPSAGLSSTPYAVDLVYQNVTFRADDGTQLHGWWIPAAYPRANLVIFHGNAGNISYCLQLLPYFHQRRFNVFLFDYRGYGQSQGTPTESGLYLDAQAAIDVALKMNKFSRPRLPLLLYAHSIGVPVALHAALGAPTPPDALILDSGFHSATNMADLLFPRLPLSHLLSARFPAGRYAAQLPGIPKLFLHSPHDQTVPFRSGRLLADEAAAPKQFVILDGGHSDHSWLLTNSPAHNAVDTFLSAILAPAR